MLYYEIRKMLGRTSNKIALLCLAAVLVLVCYFAVSGVDYVNENGDTQNGILAVRKLRELKKEWTGVLTEEKIAQAIAANIQVNQTEESLSDDIQQNNIAYGWKQGFSDIRMLMVYDYGGFRDYDYYKPDSLTPEDAAYFYTNRVRLLQEWLDTEAKDQFIAEEKEFLVQKYEELETPLYYDYADGWKQLFEYVPTILMIMNIILGFLVANIFSCEFQYKAQSIYFTSYHGRRKGTTAKITAGVLVITVIYWVMVLLYMGIVLGILGTDGAGCAIREFNT